MTGTYRFKPGCARAVAALDVIRKSLTRDGIAFTEEVDESNTIIIQACGTMAKRHSHRAPSRGAAPPPMLTVEQCEKRLAEAKKEVLNFRESFKRSMASNSKTWSHYCHDIHSRAWHRKVGRAVAKLIARHGGRETHFTVTKDDYAMLDKALGRKVKRESALPNCYTGIVEYLVKVEARGIWKRKAPRIKTNTYGPFEQGDRRNQDRVPLDISRFLELKADYEHWREMVTLAGGRELHRELQKELRAAA